MNIFHTLDNENVYDQKISADEKGIGYIKYRPIATIVSDSIHTVDNDNTWSIDAIFRRNMYWFK